MSEIICSGSHFPENARESKNGHWDRCHISRADQVVKSLNEMGVTVYNAVKCKEETTCDLDGERMKWGNLVEDPNSNIVAIEHNGSSKQFHMAVEKAKEMEKKQSLDEVLSKMDNISNKNAESKVSEKDIDLDCR